MILAPLRGVTIRCFRETFAEEIRAAGFTEAITPFITAIRGYDPLKDRELQGVRDASVKVTPQFIGKDPVALRECLLRIKSVGFDTADLNCGCPFPMVRNKGRGSGLLRAPETLRKLLEVGCEVMGAGKFSVKARLGVDANDELLRLMPLINEFPLRFLTVHSRNARQMYEGECDDAAFAKIVSAAKVPIVKNGDIAVNAPRPLGVSDLMIGRAFIRDLGKRADIAALLSRYIASSQAELFGERPVLGRMKELLAYWKELPAWSRRWDVIKLCRTLPELQSVLTACLPN